MVHAAMKNLTDRQRQVINFFLNERREGRIPTIREIGRSLGLHSPSTVSQHLERIEKKGFPLKPKKEDRRFLVFNPPTPQALRQLDRVLAQTALGMTWPARGSVEPHNLARCASCQHEACSYLPGHHVHQQKRRHISIRSQKS